MNTQLLDAMTWRYAVKMIDPPATIEPEALAALVESVRLSPSSAGLQPYQLVLVQERATLDLLAWHFMMNAEKSKSE